MVRIFPVPFGLSMIEIVDSIPEHSYRYCGPLRSSGYVRVRRGDKNTYYSSGERLLMSPVQPRCFDQATLPLVMRNPTHGNSNRVAGTRVLPIPLDPPAFPSRPARRSSNDAPWG